MGQVILGSYMVRYPLGGMMSWVLQYLVGLRRLGHDVCFVEKNGYPHSCYDPHKDVMSDDCTYGVRTVARLLSRFGLPDSLCFVDAAGTYHGLARPEITKLFTSADAFIDMGTHGAWLPEAAASRVRALIDGEPGFTQMKMVNRLRNGGTLPQYDFYFTTGRSVGTPQCTAPTAGITWRPLFHPVVTDILPFTPPPARGAFTTVMNWQSYEPVRFEGVSYGHKDVEFAKFLDLPSRVPVPMEVAVAGKDVPLSSLQAAGWHVRNAHDVTLSFDGFVRYASRSLGEFSVCKSGYVATNCGWFSDRSAVYLALGRPVVMQDTGFSHYLPCGRGLMAVRTADEAAEAIKEVMANYRQHAQWAREIARECLDADKVLRPFLADLGVQ